MRRLGGRFNRGFFDQRRTRRDWSGLDDGWRRRLGFRNGRSFGYRCGRGSDRLRWRWRDGRRFFYRSRRLRGPDCFDQPRRSKNGCRRLRRFRLLRRGGLLCTALRRCRRLGKHIAGRQRYATLPRDAAIHSRGSKAERDESAVKPAFKITGNCAGATVERIRPNAASMCAASHFASRSISARGSPHPSLARSAVRVSRSPRTRRSRDKRPRRHRRGP